MRDLQPAWFWCVIVILAAICFLPRERQQTTPAAAAAQPEPAPARITKRKMQSGNAQPRAARPLAGFKDKTVAAALPSVPHLTAPEPFAEINAVPIGTVPAVWTAAPASHQRTLAGDWLYVPLANRGSTELYPPEHIDLRLTENSDLLRGRYRARYRVGNRAISPAVAFQFEGPAGTDRAALPWTGGGGASGVIELRLLGDDSLAVTWTARSLGTELGLISGTATLVRKAE